MTAKNYRGQVERSIFFQMKRNWPILKVKQKNVRSDIRFRYYQCLLHGGTLRAPPPPKAKTSSILLQITYKGRMKKLSIFKKYNIYQSLNQKTNNIYIACIRYVFNFRFSYSYNCRTACLFVCCHSQQDIQIMACKLFTEIKLKHF